ncbi:MULTISPECIES: TetR/AcrR family transcriptional regulator [unclassified Pantoea]|uniref:TetR/AcrR family transcriptional regulator n=1 Tax=unclassified Pantoea TaxID=2630326 RepID=UPI0023DB1096|nr:MULTISPECIES: TetR/AcrR family transcriptional regulator [unclassified Pantoea]MDF2041170.1 TetR/AcrR family transcriptional regulator [Pantoea sp. Cr_R14]MDF2069857.1 TetR/AcrR family transcriptional regulator [Pantoea sp. Cr_R13]MDF2078487.1 TetR/AcrR family transcriptional regulator [Pantoea sp. Cr_R21]
MSRSDNDDFLQQRQQQIISAAKKCFSRSGFHGASMADISRESGLGAGQIYRYFESKELIVSETIKNIAENWRMFLVKNFQLKISTSSIIDTESEFWQDWSFTDRCLLLEMYSEASRNASVREMLAFEEALLMTELDSVFKQQMPAASSQQRSDRIQFLLMLVDGVACRTFGDKHLEQQELARINSVLASHLFP